MVALSASALVAALPPGGRTVDELKAEYPRHAGAIEALLADARRAGKVTFNAATQTWRPTAAAPADDEREASPRRPAAAASRPTPSATTRATKRAAFVGEDATVGLSIPAQRGLRASHAVVADNLVVRIETVGVDPPEAIELVGVEAVEVSNWLAAIIADERKRPGSRIKNAPRRRRAGAK